jgi:hypothetical protein
MRNAILNAEKLLGDQSGVEIARESRPVRAGQKVSFLEISSNRSILAMFPWLKLILR